MKAEEEYPGFVQGRAPNAWKWRIMERVDADHTAALVGGFMPGRSYEVMVLPLCEVGRGDPSEALTVSTLTDRQLVIRQRTAHMLTGAKAKVTALAAFRHAGKEAGEKDVKDNQVAVSAHPASPLHVLQKRKQTSGGAWGRARTAKSQGLRSPVSPASASPVAQQDRPAKVRPTLRAKASRTDETLGGTASSGANTDDGDDDALYDDGAIFSGDEDAGSEGSGGRIELTATERQRLREAEEDEAVSEDASDRDRRESEGGGDALDDF